LAVHFDQDHNNARHLSLKRIRKPILDQDCGPDMRLVVLKGDLLNDHAQILLQKEESGNLEGLIHFENQKVSYDLVGQCEDSDCSYSSLSLLNEKGTTLGSFGLEINDGNHSVILSSSSKKNKISSLTVVKEYSILCRTFILNNIRISYTYPHLESAKFNNWVKNEMIDWVSKLNLSLDSNDRREWGDYRAWVDIDFLNKKIISGTITKAIKGHPGHERVSFIFPLNNKSPISFNNWVKNDDDNNWLLEQDFDHQSIRLEGLCLKTEYSSIYGEKRIVIPWELLMPYLRRNNIFSKYISR